MNLLHRLGDFLVWLGVIEEVTIVTTDQPDPNQRDRSTGLPDLRCPNPACRRDFIVWTDSAWDEGQFITRYWRGCPKYANAGWDEWGQHYAKWKKSSWGTRSYVEKKAGK